MAFTKIDSVKLNSRGATTLDNKPQISATKLKEEFDAPAKQIVAPALNNLIDELETDTAAVSIGANVPNGLPDLTQKNLQSILNAINTVAQDSKELAHKHENKDVLDTITEDVVMDADYVHTDNNYTDADKDLVQSAVQDSDYVHTDNNYTNSEKNKLATVDEYANNYVLPNASETTLGGIKVDGTSATVDANGVLHVQGGGGGAADAYKTIRVGSTDIVASGEDTLQFVQGANVTLTPDPVTKKVTISATGGSGGGGGDMYMAVYDTDSDGIVNSADTLNGLTATVTELNFVGGVRSGIQGQLDALSTTVNTKADKTVTSGLRTDVDALKDKAQNLDNDGKISSDNVLYGSMTVADKLDEMSVQLKATCNDKIATVTDMTYIGADYLLEEYCDNPSAYIKSRSVSGNTLTVEFSDTVTDVVVIATKKGVV